MRGERPSCAIRPYALFGSSPHARGTLRRRCCAQLCDRIIPACAGNAPARPRSRSRGSDHPRMRGERPVPCVTVTLSAGSSPHARGTREQRAALRCLDRIIPACAGNASRRARTRPRPTDHPRMRGERSDATRGALSSGGSSPHARGTLPESSADSRSWRIIPACAGNAAHRAPAPDARADHPRMRGERIPRETPEDGGRGSSPHARGTRDELPSVRGDHRIIPACAGNATARRSAPASSPDHPRMRGERFRARFSTSFDTGSSPHARGTPHPQGVERSDWRIIPACAGNACAHWPWASGSPDHPRMRGERVSVSSDSWSAIGSSPHARGTPVGRVRISGGGRIIPACAGNASVWQNG